MYELHHVLLLVLDDALAPTHHLGQQFLDFAIPGAAGQLVPAQRADARILPVSVDNVTVSDWELHSPLHWPKLVLEAVTLKLA